MLEIENLHVEVDGKRVLKGLSLKVNRGEVHAIMGPNGSGKSTLSKVISGHPAYTIVDGRILFEVNSEMRDIKDLQPDERAKEGIFLAFQYPIEVPGVSNLTFLRTAFNSICRHQGVGEMDEATFDKFLSEKMKLVEMSPSLVERPVNVGFSGGEKKRNEILQMAVLSPRLSLLDETDSGLDVDSLRIVANGVNKMRNRHNAMIVITHYQRLLDYIVPDFVHVLVDGRIVKSGAKELALQVEEKGYDWLAPGQAEVSP